MDNSEKVGNSGEEGSAQLDRVISFLRFAGILKDLKRTGWVRKRVKRPETVSGHMYRMALAAYALSAASGVDTERCIRMALVHDLAEAHVGDITPNDPVSGKEKHMREREAMLRVKEMLLVGLPGDPGAEMMHLWEEYERGETAEARFVKDLDKFDMVLQAAEYEAAGRVQPRGALSEFKWSGWKTDIVKGCALRLGALREGGRELSMEGFSVPRDEFGAPDSDALRHSSSHDNTKVASGLAAPIPNCIERKSNPMSSLFGPRGTFVRQVNTCGSGRWVPALAVGFAAGVLASSVVWWQCGDPVERKDGEDSL